MGEWTHSICESCWKRREGGRRPVAVVGFDAEICCFCGTPTIDGIWVRHDPQGLRCMWNHEETSGSDADPQKVNGILCLPCDGHDLRSVVEGSTKNVCSACATAVWLSPTSQELHRKGVRILCIPCAYKDADPKKSIVITKDQKIEISTHENQKKKKKKENPGV